MAGRSVAGSEEAPLAGDALQSVNASMGESDSGSRHQVLDGVRDHCLAGFSLADDARADVHRDASDFAPCQFTLANVKAGSDLQAQIPHGVPDSAGAANSLGRGAEPREEVVASGGDFPALKSRELMALGATVLGSLSYDRPTWAGQAMKRQQFHAES